LRAVRTLGGIARRGVLTLRSVVTVWAVACGPRPSGGPPRPSGWWSWPALSRRFRAAASPQRGGPTLSSTAAMIVSTSMGLLYPSVPERQYRPGRRTSQGGRGSDHRTLFGWLCAGGVVSRYAAPPAPTVPAPARRRRRDVSVVVQLLVARPRWTTSGSGGRQGFRPCQRQIQETPRILIPFPEMVRPTRRRTGRVTGALRGAMSACGPERTPFIRRAL
jgi:hypothetical protein